MRQVFSSARLENVEAVAKLLEDAGIEARVTNGRSYKSAIRGNFSYRDDGKQLPAVWIVRSEDQPRAREMLREAGLMDSSRNAPDTYLAMSFRGTNPDPRDGLGDGARKRRAFRIKLGLLVVIAAVVALAFMSFRTGRTPAPAEVATSIAASLPARGTAPVPASLGLAMLRGELPDEADSIVCIAIDARDPTPAFLAMLPKTAATVVPVSRCPAQGARPSQAGAVLPLLLAVGRYESTVPSGAGIVYMVRRRGTGPVVPRWFEARPEGDGWRIVQPL